MNQWKMKETASAKMKLLRDFNSFFFIKIKYDWVLLEIPQCYFQLNFFFSCGVS